MGPACLASLPPLLHRATQVLLLLGGRVFVPVCRKLFRMWQTSGKPFPRPGVSGCSTLEMSSQEEEFSPAVP